MNITYRLDIHNVDGSYYMFIVDDLEHVKHLLKEHDHEGSMVTILKMENITKEVYGE